MVRSFSVRVHKSKGNKLQITKKTLYLLSFFTLFGFSISGYWTILLFQDVPIKEFWIGKMSFAYQLGIGLAYGLLTAFLALRLIKSSFMESVTKSFMGLFAHLDLKIWDIVFFSFCAGVGEEIFFRGGLQPLVSDLISSLFKSFDQLPMLESINGLQTALGIWLTAIFFVLIHGYLNPKNWRMMLYGIILTLIVVGMGYLFDWYGIWAAAAAHFIFDVVMFRHLIRKT